MKSAGSVRFVMGGQPVELSGFDPQLTVLEWLRTRVRRPGTKEGCAEGDCGACTVVLGEWVDGGMRYRAVNACIQLLATLDGCQLITVEDLQGADGSLHPVQQALVDQHGSQCGFCTPGFVMSLFAMYHEPGAKPDRPRIDEGLAGNLCRCTGYAPIIRAAEQVLQKPADDHFTAREAETGALLRDIRRSERLELRYGDRRYYAPVSTDDLCRLLDQHPGAVLFSGATDVGLWITKQLKEFDTLVYLGRVRELRELRADETGGCLEIGAGGTASILNSGR